MSNKILIQVVAILAVSLGSVAHANEGPYQWRLRGGFGFGMKNDVGLVFGSLGCDQYSSLQLCDDRYSIGYFRPGLIWSSFNGHALGLYVGQFDRSKELESAATHGLGINYVFLPTGIGETGFSLGLGYEIGQTDGGTDHHRLRVQVGVQF